MNIIKNELDANVSFFMEMANNNHIFRILEKLFIIYGLGSYALIKMLDEMIGISVDFDVEFFGIYKISICIFYNHTKITF